MAQATLSTHVLDTTNGVPAAGVAVTLYRDDAIAAKGVTGKDGRVANLGDEHEPGTYRLVFDVGAYFRSRELDTFLGSVSLEVRLASGHQHIPLLVSRYGVVSYLGS
ncbi:MAG TPA: hydroxyisourate hydrolase [Candidatus Limnocylindria bacterium]|nr:hydroxyisourate hydrolase [Candidatus Limnocylindria bacterium]